MTSLMPKADRISMQDLVEFEVAVLQKALRFTKERKRSANLLLEWCFVTTSTPSNCFANIYPRTPSTP